MKSDLQPDPAKAGFWLSNICQAAMRTPLAIVAVGLLIGCSHPYGVRVNTTRPLTDDEAHIIEIARQSLIGGGKRVEFEVPRRDPEGGWSVVAWRLPKVPCGTWSILIDENDRVIASKW